jgi:hypothetical protein
MDIQEKKNFHFKMPNSFQDVSLIKLFVSLNDSSYNKSNILVHEFSTNHPGKELFVQSGLNETLYFTAKSLSNITETNIDSIITLEDDTFLNIVNENKRFLERCGTQLNKDLSNVLSKLFFKLSGMSNGYTIILNLSFTNDFTICEMYYIQAIAILIAKQKIKDYSNISIILNYENDKLFTKDILKIFILNILKAIKHLTASNFISISKIKEKLSEADDKRYAHLLVNTIYDCDVILDQNINNTLFRLFKFNSLSTGNNKNPLTIGPKKYFENHHEDFIYI